MMPRFLRSIFIPAVLAFLGLVPTLSHGAAPARDPFIYFFDPSFGDLKEEIKLARAEGKRALFLMFDDENCPHCQKMLRAVLNQPRVQDYYRHNFRVLHIDINGGLEMTDLAGRQLRQKDFAKAQRVPATPTFLFIGTDGQELARYTGATRDIEEFLWLAEFVVNGDYKKKNFQAYRRERLAAPGR